MGKLSNLKDKLQRKNKEKKSVNLTELKGDSPTEPGTAKALLVFEKMGKVGYRNIAQDMVPTDAIPFADDSYFLNFDGDTLISISSLQGGEVDLEDDDPIEAENMDSPESCYEAQFWEELTTILSHRNDRTEQIKLGIFIALCAGALGALIIFLIVAVSYSGGPPHA